VMEERQGHMRGGVEEPLTRADIEEKFRLNCAYGGWEKARAEKFLGGGEGAFDAQRIELREFRS